MPAQIGKRRETELEELYWTDKVFTGDNPAATVFHLSQVNQRNQNHMHSKKQQDQEKPKSGGQNKMHSVADSVNMKHKGQLNAEAEAETQLVHLKNTVTGDGKVDIAKVQDIVRALRRRYSTRANVQSIFKDWDNKG